MCQIGESELAANAVNRMEFLDSCRHLLGQDYVETA